MAEKELSRRKLLKIKDKTTVDKGGRPPNILADKLTEEQKDLAYFLAIPMDDKVILQTPLSTTGRPVSKHCLNAWRVLPLMVDEVAKWKKIFGSEHIIQFRMMYEELVKEVTADGIRKAQKGEMSVKEVMDFINSTAANVGLLQYQDKAIPARHKVSAEKTVGGTTLRKEVTYNKNIDELPPEDEAALFEDLNDDVIEGRGGG